MSLAGRYRAEDARAVDNQALRWAAHNGHVDVLQWLHATYGLTAEDARAKDNCALRWSASNGRVDAVNYLLNVMGLTAEDARYILSRLSEEDSEQAKVELRLKAEQEEWT